jgi:hypothetical protein
MRNLNQFYGRTGFSDEIKSEGPQKEANHENLLLSICSSPALF